MAGRWSDRLPRASRDVLQEFCDRPDFSEISDIDDLSDDEAGDPSFVLPPPRINEVPQEESDDSDEDNAAQQHNATSPQRQQPSPAVQQPTAAAPQQNTAQPAIPDYAAASLLGTWNVTDKFYPLPAAPEYEGDDGPLESVSTVDNFKRYIPDTLIQDMTKCTNAQILTATGKDAKLTSTDIKVFIGITIKMSYLKLPRIRMYWAARTRVADIADAMSRNKYFLVRSHFRVRDYSLAGIAEKRNNKYWKVAPILQAIRSACLDNPRPANVAMDEQMIPFWGHTKMRQRVKGKPNPCGLKNFVVCASDGLPLDFFLYEGKGDSILPDNDLIFPGLDIGGKVIVRLSRTLPKGTSIFMDRYFTSLLLLDELHLLGFQGTGTLKTDRIPKTPELYTDAELRRGGRGYFNQVVRDDGQIAVVKWFDSKPVVLTSTVHGSEPTDKCKRWCKKERRYVQVDRPIIIKHYNEKMGGVDLLDRVVSYYRICARTKKWTVRLLFHMIDFVIAAGWIYNRRVEAAFDTPKKDLTDQLQYKTDLADRLIHQSAVMMEEVTDDEEEDDIPGPPAKRKKPNPLPSDVKRTTEARHLPELVSASHIRHRCRFPGCTSTNARFFCTTCKVHLCITNARNCYKVFHQM